MRGSGGVYNIYITVRTSIRGSLAGLLLFVSGMLEVTNLEAQMVTEDAASSGSTIEFFAVTGVLQPLANFTTNPTSFGTQISPSLTYGGELTFWSSDLLGIGIMGAYAPADMSAFTTQLSSPAPTDLGSTDYMAGLLNLTFRINSSGSASALEPYFTIGGGVRRILVDGTFDPEVTSSTDPAATAALGIRVPAIAGLWFRGELRNIASRYKSPATGEMSLQNDILITVGIGLR